MQTTKSFWPFFFGGGGLLFVFSLQLLPWFLSAALEQTQELHFCLGSHLLGWVLVFPILLIPDFYHCQLGLFSLLQLDVVWCFFWGGFPLALVLRPSDFEAVKTSPPLTLAPKSQPRLGLVLQGC